MREKTRVLTVLAAVAAGTVVALSPPATADPTTATTTTLVSSANPSVVGQAVTLTATVAGDAPGGSVVFADSGVTLATADLFAGAASVVVPSLPAGAHALTATYAGDMVNLGSVGTLTQSVTAVPVAPVAPVKPPKIKLVASSTKVSVGDKVRLRWRSKRADVVMASGEWAGTQKSKGSAAVRIAERGKHVFKLTVQNAGGTKTATVTVLASRKAKTLELVVTDELTMVGTSVDVSADGLAKGEEYTVRLDGKPVMTGKADKRGDVHRSFKLAKTAPEGALPLTITGSNPNRLGTAELTVIKPKKLTVEVSESEVFKKAEVTITVTGLVAAEPLTVMYLGKKLTEATADAQGKFTYTFEVGKESGEHTIKVIGADPSRTGETTVTVAGGGGGHGGGGGGGSGGGGGDL
jgi:hypothetical protein